MLLGARLVPLDAPGTPIELRGDLPRAVPPGGRVAARIDLPWPVRPGRYKVTLDLVLEDVAWFADRVGSPAAEGIVRVLPAVGEVPAAPSRR